MSLDADCTTSATVLVPDGFTLDGNGHTIQAVDPAGDHFRGAVVRNEGATAHVIRLSVTVSGLANVCDANNDRLRGILFEGVSGSVTHSQVVDLNQGVSGCQEGNAIEIRDLDENGTSSVVEVAHNAVLNWQKTGIVCNGDSECDIHHNIVGASATQAALAANSIQVGFGARANVSQNRISGNHWCGPSDFVATAVLLVESGPTLLFNNDIGGNSDVGIYSFGTDVTVINNRLIDEGVDCNQHGYDYGIGNWGTGGSVVNNKVSGFMTPFDGVTGGGNKARPGSSAGEVFFK